MSPYPLFIPPAELHEVPRDKWTISQAKMYFSWLMQERSHRVKALLSFLEIAVDCHEEKRKLLNDAATKVADLLLTDDFSSDGVLTSAGYSIAADLGLLLVACLEAEFSSISWEIRKKPKSDINFMMPCYLVPGDISRDPVFISTSCAFSVLRHEGGAEHWLMWYDSAREKLRKKSTGHP